MNKKGIYTLFVLLILALVLSACVIQTTTAPVVEEPAAPVEPIIVEEPAAPVEPIRVGSTVPLTGFLAPTGGAIHPLIGDLFLKRLNESGGLLGRPVEWIALDDESSPANVTELYERLITEEKVDLIIGPHGSDSNLAAMNVAEKYGMVIPHHTSGLTYAYTYARHFSADPLGLHPNITHAETLFEALESSGAPPKTVAFVISQYELDQFIAHGHEGSGGAVDVAEERGYEVVLAVEYPAGTTDFSAIADQVKAADADFLYVLGVGLDGLNLIKALQALDYHPPALYPSFTPLGPWIATGENVLSVLPFAPYEPYLSYPDAAWLNEAYTTAATEAGLRNTALDAVSAQSWAAWQILAAGVEGAGSLDQAAIADWLQHHEVETIMGPMTFDPENQNYGPSLHAIAQIQDGKWVMVYPPELATADYTVQYSPGDESTAMQGAFLVRNVTLEADELNIDLPSCGDDIKIGPRAWSGNGSADLLEEGSILLIQCDHKIWRTFEGTGILTRADGETLLLNYSGSYIEGQGLHATYEIAGGTGEFVDATGEGTISQKGTRFGDDYTYTFELDGSIVTPS